MSAPRNLDELAAGEIDDIDIANLHRMAQLYELLDPVPAGLVERIQFGITLDALHAEIAELHRRNRSQQPAALSDPPDRQAVFALSSRGIGPPVGSWTRLRVHFNASVCGSCTSVLPKALGGGS